MGLHKDRGIAPEKHAFFRRYSIFHLLPKHPIKVRTSQQIYITVSRGKLHQFAQIYTTFLNSCSMD